MAGFKSKVYLASDARLSSFERLQCTVWKRKVCLIDCYKFSAQAIFLSYSFFTIILGLISRGNGILFIDSSYANITVNLKSINVTIAT